MPPSSKPNNLTVEDYERNRKKDREAHENCLRVATAAILQHTDAERIHKENIEKITADKEIAIKEREIAAAKELKQQEMLNATAERKSQEFLRTLELMPPTKREHYLRIIPLLLSNMELITMLQSTPCFFLERGMSMTVRQEEVEADRVEMEASHSTKEEANLRAYAASMLRQHNNDVDGCVHELRSKNHDIRMVMPHLRGERMNRITKEALLDAWKLLRAVAFETNEQLPDNISPIHTILHLHFRVEKPPAMERMRKDRASMQHIEGRH